MLVYTLHGHQPEALGKSHSFVRRSFDEAQDSKVDQTHNQYEKMICRDQSEYFS